MSKRQEAKPFLTYAIIVGWIVVMILASTPPASGVIQDEYALKPSYVSQGMRLISVLTYSFVHSDWVQLVLNCFALFVVGTIIEGEVGSARYGIVFLGSGVIAGLAHIVFNPSSTVVVTGSSGAVFGLLALLFLLAPFKKTTMFGVPIPAALVGVLVASIELAGAAWAGGGVCASDVQIAGFVTGAALSFWIDVKKAIKWLSIGVGVVIVLYALGLFLNLI